jgi:gliding motility-associated-like protein
MPRHSLFLTLVFLTGFLFPVFGQEICNNQTDDDNDGQIDFADCDCLSKRGNVWHFGPGFSIDFNSDSPEVLTGSPIESFEGTSSICDEDGNLLFFTNGGGRPTINPAVPLPPGTIWDQNGDVMYDMMGEQGGGYSSQQSSVIVPKPGSSSNYYLFTMDQLENPDNRGFRYFEIDMNGNGGLGEVVVADQQLYGSTYEALAAVRHENEQDYWIIIVNPQNPQREFLVYEATAFGVSLSGNYTFDLGAFELFPSKIKASPTGDRINQRQNGEITFFDFDNATGVISNPIKIPTTTFGYGDFSPSGRYYYCEDGDLPATTERRISRIDLSNLSPDSPFEVIETLTVDADKYLQWQLGPLGQIYFFEVTGSTLGAILCPDSETPTVEPQYLSLISTPGAAFTNNSYALPNFPNHFFFRPVIPLELTGETAYDLCGAESVTLTVQTNKCADLLWSTGETTNNITVDAPGIYTVTATDGCETQTLEIEVTTDNPGQISVNAPTAVCGGNSVSLTGFLDGATSWTWLDLDGNILFQNQTFSFILTQDTVLIVQAELDCGIAEEQVEIQVVPFPNVDLDVNNLSCTAPDGSATIINPAPTWTAIWLDDSGNTLSNELFADGLPEGDYQLEVTNTIAGQNCFSIINFSVVQTSTFESVSFEVTNNPCPGDAVGRIEVTDLDGTPPYTYQWTESSTGLEIGMASTLENLQDGLYNLLVTDAEACSLELPVAITSTAPPTIELDTDPAFCGGENGSIFLSADDPDNIEILLDGTPVEEADLANTFSGAYRIQVQSPAGCLWLDSLLTVEDIDPFGLDGDTTLFAFQGQPFTINLELPAGGDFEYEWSPGIGLSCTDCSTPLAIVEGDTRFTLFLEETNTGCTGRFTVDIITRPPEKVFIPNAFSPNDDGFNDLFEVYPSDAGVQLTNMQIFDRWGELIFERAAPDATWDGTFNGQEMPVGVYVYVIEVQKSSGSDLISGDVLLVR